MQLKAFGFRSLRSHLSTNNCFEIFIDYGLFENREASVLDSNVHEIVFW